MQLSAYGAQFTESGQIVANREMHFLPYAKAHLQSLAKRRKSCHEIADSGSKIFCFRILGKENGFAFPYKGNIGLL